jgi:hypothetical protein
MPDIQHLLKIKASHDLVYPALTTEDIRNRWMRVLRERRHPS